ncbi:MAG: hypothetical protein ACD_41C00142G0003 [uncultured bacterium]|nr:MAG: hypothetical protein ACD_41C00142G0003 [uncultured bacterium]
MIRSQPWLVIGIIFFGGCGAVQPAVETRPSLATAVSDNRQYVATVTVVGEKYALLLDGDVILGLDAIPTELEFSPTNDALLVVVSGDLYRYDIPARQATRLYEGVLSAEFSPSGQDIDYVDI